MKINYTLLIIIVSFILLSCSKGETSQEKEQWNPNWPVLKTYEGKHLAEVAMPLGGIGTGTVSIGGKETLQAPIDDASISMAMVHYGNVAYRIDKGFDIDPKTGKMLDKDAMKLWGREYAKGWEPKL